MSLKPSGEEEKRGRLRRTRAAAVELPAKLDLERAVDVNQVAALTGHATITLAQWRAQGKGPRFFRIGRNVRYRLGDVLAFRDERMVGKR